MAELRRRQVSFSNPILFPEVDGKFEKDPERALWVPGRKAFFLPTVRQVEFFHGIDWASIVERAFEVRGSFYDRFAECVPSRSSLMNREPRVIRYNDIVRSTTPAFRSNRRWISERW